MDKYLETYKIKVLKPFEFKRIGEEINLFENDFRRVEKQYKGYFELIKKGVLKC